MNAYEVLGVPEGAEQTQVKRAYFRLLRQHSPEKDPEGFARIREAYEKLSSSSETEDGPDFDLPDRPYVKQFCDQIERCRERCDYDYARQTAEEAWRVYPDIVYFLYQTAVTQRECGNTGKAVKSAELLIKKEPENKWFWREYALANYERGYTKKAYPAFQKAWELGCRDMDFIFFFSLECRSYPDPEKGKELLSPYTEPEYRWKKEDLYAALDAFSGTVYFTVALGEGLDELADRFCTFLERYRLPLTDEIDACADVMGELFTNGVAPEFYHRGMEVMQSIADNGKTAAQKEEYQNYLIGLQIAYMNQDNRVCRSMQYMNEILSFPEEVPRFGRIDCQLCMIEERELILENESYIKEAYPDFYSSVRSFVDRIRTEGSAFAQRQRLLGDYRKQLEYYESGRYLEWFPDRRDDVFGRPAIRQETAYVRQGKKIGRNDPCPCGSGKKYKHCCGR